MADGTNSDAPTEATQTPVTGLRSTDRKGSNPDRRQSVHATMQADADKTRLFQENATQQMLAKEGLAMTEVDVIKV